MTPSVPSVPQLARLPGHVRLAYDGLRFEVRI